MEVLNVNNLSKVYRGKVPYKALNNISFSIEDGEFVGIMGPSGSGKTTLLNMISTVDKPTSGEITINGKNPSKLNGDELALFRRRELGFVFQDFNLIDTLTLGENIILPLTLDGVDDKIQINELKRIADILGIEKIINKRTFEVSGGQSQRAAIARAVIHKPKLLLADEPTGNLDSKAAEDVMELFQKINEEEKVTTVMVTHDPVSASYCKRILFIKDGQIYNEIYKDGTNRDFYEDIIDVLAMIGGRKL
ncbi:MAG: ABC transporter ATP-binding protein [Inconstantimicrobium porci]|uniref:ABC transporter ATP-binding protein n=1 Tax=Inconstantimicrobium porci TaxID=2652291 RepID=A0A7X2T2R2_9CLOT|nr:ABC transporter ATP-binding protein [Inconstantimicrobium porci]MDD6771805.1 ABC transporter ATP-binding protein [Inconstantimicrobium porci]MDY5913137.1 ABC transporter ATP-binding protein [Inconstantimicrobium porci]MSR92223.1 ABC transporter ATP-binding protein [Inconstantimicrobium porci]